MEVQKNQLSLIKKRIHKARASEGIAEEEQFSSTPDARGLETHIAVNVIESSDGMYKQGSSESDSIKGSVENRDLVSTSDRTETDIHNERSRKVSSRGDSKVTQPQNISADPSWAIKWTCSECHNNCIPVRSESRCLW